MLYISIYRDVQRYCIFRLSWEDKHGRDSVFIIYVMLLPFKSKVDVLFLVFFQLL